MGIDDPTTVTRLMERIQARLPILALPTAQLVRALRERGLKISPGRAVLINRVFYLGDEGGISCDVTPAGDAKMAFVVSLTHLRVAPGHPLSRDIRAYQRERVKRIAKSGL